MKYLLNAEIQCHSCQLQQMEKIVELQLLQIWRKYETVILMLI